MTVFQLCCKMLKRQKLLQYKKKVQAKIALGYSTNLCSLNKASNIHYFLRRFNFIFNNLHIIFRLSIINDL